MSAPLKGSKEWIGANEVCFVLESLTGLSSRIEFVSSGGEMESKGRLLAKHFETVSLQHTPCLGCSPSSAIHHVLCALCLFFSLSVSVCLLFVLQKQDKTDWLCCFVSKRSVVFPFPYLCVAQMYGNIIPYGRGVRLFWAT